MKENVNENKLVQGWLWALKAKGKDSIRIGNRSTQEAIDRVGNFLDKEIKHLERGRIGSNKPLYFSLIRARNVFRKNENGHYDDLISHLRGLQQRETIEHPNLYYEVFRIAISKSTADSYIKRMPKKLQVIMEKSADEFLKNDPLVFN